MSCNQKRIPYIDIFKLLPPLVVGSKVTPDTMRIHKALFLLLNFKRFEICYIDLFLRLTFLHPLIKKCQGNILSAILFFCRESPGKVLQYLHYFHIWHLCWSLQIYNMDSSFQDLIHIW